MDKFKLLSVACDLFHLQYDFETPEMQRAIEEWYVAYYQWLARKQFE